MAEVRPQYIGMNQELVAAAARHPEVELVDWGAASRGHDSWFQPDGVHLTYDGARAMAHLLHDALVARPRATARRHAHAPPRRTRRQALLGATHRPRRNGTVPLAADLRPAHSGLHVLAGGRIVGTPRRSGRLVLTLQTTDAVAQAASLKATVTVSHG